MENEAQQEFDALVEKFGAEAMVKAVKSHHIKNADGTNCTQTGCPPHYICSSSGNCVLDIG
jgi:hypothetical protein